MSPRDPFEEQIATYALGALEEEDRRQLEAHLRRCSHCRAELREVRTIVNLLPLSAEPIQPGAETKRRLMARIQADRLENSSGPGLPFHPVHWAIPILALALAIAVILALALLALSVFLLR